MIVVEDSNFYLAGGFIAGMVMTKIIDLFTDYLYYRGRSRKSKGDQSGN